MVFAFGPDAKPGKPACADLLTDMCRAGPVFDNVEKLILKNVRGGLRRESGAGGAYGRDHREQSLLSDINEIGYTIRNIIYERAI